MEMTIQAASLSLGISETTIRRRLRKGSIAGRKNPSPSGYTWVVEVPEHLGQADHTRVSEDIHLSTPTSKLNDYAAANHVEALEGTIVMLREQLLATNSQLGHALSVIGEFQKALPAPATSRQWWKVWG